MVISVCPEQEVNKPKRSDKSNNLLSVVLPVVVEQYAMAQSGNYCLSVVAAILAALIGLLFTMSGAMKLTPNLNEGVHQQMKVEFVRMAPTFPLTVLFGIKIDPDVYRLAVGVVEVILGPLLALASGNLKKLANFVLFIIMCGAVYTLCALGEEVGKIAVPAVLAVLLLFRFYADSCTHSQPATGSNKRD